MKRSCLQIWTKDERRSKTDFCQTDGWVLNGGMGTIFS
jgi:hypothetical protein